MALSLYYDCYRCTGDLDNPPNLVLLHGWGMHSAVWDPVMPALLERFQVTVIDLPGLGRSPMPAGDYDLDYLVQQVLSVAPEHGVWMGWSLGGMVATAIASRYPEKVSALVTVATTPKFVANSEWPLAMEEHVLDAFIQMLEEDNEGTLIRFLSLQCKGSISLKDDIRQLRELLHLHGLPAPKALRQGLHILKQADLRQALSQVQCPSLHIFGANDHLVPVGVSKLIAQLQPAGQNAVIKEVAHVPFVSEPELFMAACNDFFSQCL